VGQILAGRIRVVANREWFGSGHEPPESGSYVGLTRADALDAARIAGIEAVHVFETAGRTYTTDLNPQRLDLLIEDVVVAAAFFSRTAPLRRLRVHHPLGPRLLPHDVSSDRNRS